MTSYINIRTGEYPYSFAQVQTSLRHISLPPHPTEAQLLKHGFCKVKPTPKPEGFIVEEEFPRFVDDAFHQTWKVVQRYNLNQLKTQCIQRLEQEFKGLVQEGYDIDNTHRLALDDDQELSYVFLECLLLKDEDSEETVSLPLVGGSSLEVTFDQALSILRLAIRLKRSWLQQRKQFQQTLRDVSTLEELQHLEPSITLKEVPVC